MLDFLHLDEEGLPKVLPIIDLSPLPQQAIAPAAATATPSTPPVQTNDQSGSQSEESTREADEDGHKDGFAHENCSDNSARGDADGDAKDSIVVDNVADDSDGGTGGVGSSQEHAVQEKGE